MKAETYNVDVTVRLILTGRELELLHHITSYNNKREFAKGMVSSTYAGGVTEDEMVQFMDKIHLETAALINHINAGKSLLKS